MCVTVVVVVHVSALLITAFSHSLHLVSGTVQPMGLGGPRHFLSSQFHMSSMRSACKVHKRELVCRTLCARCGVESAAAAVLESRLCEPVGLVPRGTHAALRPCGSFAVDVAAARHACLLRTHVQALSA